MSLAVLLSCCSPEGAGTIEVGSPAEVRAKLTEGDTPTRLDAKRQRDMLKVGEVARKHAKLD